MRWRNSAIRSNLRACDASQFPRPGETGIAALSTPAASSTPRRQGRFAVQHAPAWGASR